MQNPSDGQPSPRSPESDRNKKVIRDLAVRGFGVTEAYKKDLPSSQSSLQNISPAEGQLSITEPFQIKEGGVPIKLLSRAVATEELMEPPFNDPQRVNIDLILYQRNPQTQEWGAVAIAHSYANPELAGTVEMKPYGEQLYSGMESKDMLSIFTDAVDAAEGQLGQMAA